MRARRWRLGSLLLGMTEELGRRDAAVTYMRIRIHSLGINLTPHGNCARNSPERYPILVVVWYRW